MFLEQRDVALTMAETMRLLSPRSPSVPYHERHHRWLLAVEFIDGQIQKYVAANQPEAVAAGRACLAELIAERCIECGKFFDVASEDHVAGCHHAESK